MVIRAKVKFNCEENAEELIKAFFSEKAFNPRNKLDIHENECNIEIVFEEKPAENLIEAIAFCDIHFLIYNKENDVSEEKNITSTEEISNLPEKVNETVEIPVTSEDETASNESVSEEKTISIPAESKDVSMEADIPEEIKSIIRANNDKNVICHEISLFFKMHSYESYFENFLMEAFNLEESKITWRYITELLEKRGIKEPAKGTAITFSNKISKVIKKYNLPSIGFKALTILVINYYKECWGTGNNNEVKSEEVKPEEIKKEKPFAGLPENAIFDEKIAQMPVEFAEIDKINYIFSDALNADYTYQFSSTLYQILLDNDSESFEDVLLHEFRAKIATAIHNVWSDVKVKEFLTELKKFVF